MIAAPYPANDTMTQPNWLIRRVAVIGLLLAVTLAVFTAALLAQPSLQKKARDLMFAAQRPFATYDDKMRLQMGVTYDYLLFVRAHTPESAVILVAPPDYTLPHLGSISIARYFLYPRDAVQQNQADRATHAMLVPGWAPNINLAIPVTRSWGLVDLTTGQVTWMDAGLESP
jgi:hypothetical protein